jgi:dihydroorotate dehydrogenase electron transfer subunit
MAATAGIQATRTLAGVVESKSLSPTHPGHHRLVLETPRVAENAVPGQFVHALPRSAELMLRRPFSIMTVDHANGLVSIVFRVIGEGTAILAKLRRGDSVDIIGPLGNGFPIDSNQSAVLVGGGVGIPPLVFLAEALLAKGLTSNPDDKKSIRVFLGARDLATLVCNDEFRAMGIKPVVATEDGSAGVPGLVTTALDAGHSFHRDSITYTCGPIPMLRAVAKWSDSKGFRCWVSMENKLGCGIGACLGCSIPVRVEGGGGVRYERVCCDGPAFDASTVAFDLI